MINPKNVNIANLPFVPLEDKKQLPAIAGIYFAIDSIGNVQYIGRTKNLKARWIRHHKENDLEELPNVKIAYLEINEQLLLPEIEKALINWFNPFLNKKAIKPKKNFASFSCSKKDSPTIRKKTAIVKNKTVRLNFAQWLRLKRDILGLDRSQLAEKIGVKPSTVSSWERKINNPRLNPYQMERFCETLQVDLPELSKAFQGEYEVNG